MFYLRILPNHIYGGIIRLILKVEESLLTYLDRNSINVKYNWNGASVVTLFTYPAIF